MGSGIVRHAINLGGLALILLSQFISVYLVSLGFFLAALVLLVYSRLSNRRRGFVGLVKEVGERVREAFMGERESYVMDAFWLYLSFGVLFVVFPSIIAVACGIIVCAGGSLSAATDMKYGDHRMAGNVSLEGSVVFFLAGFLLTAFLVGSVTAFLGSVSASLAGIVSGAKENGKQGERGLINGNWVVPILSGLVMYIACNFIGCM
jgi:dolichol kinase